MGKHSRNSKQRTEDTQPDPHRADSRDTGGVPNPDMPDQGSTTGTTPDAEYVGRVGGQDVGYAGETGAERRAADSGSLRISGRPPPTPFTIEGPRRQE